MCDSPLSRRVCETAALSEPWLLTDGATTARERAWRDDTVPAAFRFRGRGVRGLAVEESESCTVTQLITLVRWLRPTLKKVKPCYISGKWERPLKEKRQSFLLIQPQKMGHRFPGVEYFAIRVIGPALIYPIVCNRTIPSSWKHLCAKKYRVLTWRDGTCARLPCRCHCE